VAAVIRMLEGAARDLSASQSPGAYSFKLAADLVAQETGFASRVWQYRLAAGKPTDPDLADNAL